MTTSSNSLLYKTIKNNGGWDNWDMIPIIRYPCYSEVDALIKEREYQFKLKANLNKRISGLPNYVSLLAEWQYSPLVKRIDLEIMTIEERMRWFKELPKLETI
jgi:hypothetical protein